MEIEYTEEEHGSNRMTVAKVADQDEATEDEDSENVSGEDFASLGKMQMLWTVSHSQIVNETI